MNGAADPLETNGGLPDPPGFVAAGAAEEALAERLSALGLGRPCPGSLYARTIPGGRVYLFDLDEGSPQPMSAVVDSNLRLPRFSFGIEPGGDIRVQSPDEASTYAFLTPERLALLSSLDRSLQIEAGGDTFAVRTAARAAEGLVDLLVQLNGWFAGAPSEREE